MKLFKKALVATAIVGAFGAQAADLTDAVTKTSKQGLEVLGAAESSVRVIVREQLEAGDLVTLDFGDGVDLTTINTVDVDGTPTTADDALNIVYGSGTYTFSQHSSTDLSENKLVLEVNTGDPVTLDSSFEVSLGKDAFVVTKATQATVTYSAVSGLTGDAKDTSGDNTGSFIVLADQYTASVKAKFDAILDRTDASSIIENGEVADGTADAGTDTLTIDVTDSQGLLSAILANDINGDATTTDNVTLEFSLEGDFTGYDASEIDAFFSGDTTTSVIANAAINAGESELTFEVSSATLTELEDVIVTLVGDNADAEFNPSDFEVSVDVEFGGANPLTVLNNADAGEIKLDATLVNIPYFPVGFEGLDTSVHFANEASSDADVIITAIDDAGKEYTSMGSTITLDADTVTKFRQDEVQSWLKDEDGNPVADKTKLSVTFNIDADDGDVNAYAFSNAKAAGARQSLVTSQQKGK